MHADVQAQRRYELGYISGYRDRSEKRYPVFMSLTEFAIRAAKPQPKPYKLLRREGAVPARETKWRAACGASNTSHGGVEKLLSLGAYPESTKARTGQARRGARASRRRQSIPARNARQRSPRMRKPSRRLRRNGSRPNADTLTASTWQRDRDQLFKLVGPYLGKRPIAEIEAPELLEVLKRLERRGVRDTAHRVRAVCGRVFRYAIATGRAKHDISADLKGALAPKALRAMPQSPSRPRSAQLMRAIAWL